MLSKMKLNVCKVVDFLFRVRSKFSFECVYLFIYLPSMKNRLNLQYYLIAAKSTAIEENLNFPLNVCM